MRYLYLLLDIGVISIPFLFSFNNIGHFYKRLKQALLAIFMVGIGFIVWDIWFTNLGVWGFNESYLVGINLVNLPIEEWLFFLCIPYACLFSYDQLVVLGVKNRDRITNALDAVFVLAAILYLFIGYYGLYTLVVSITTLLLVLLFRLLKPENRTVFYLTYAIILVPFVLVNGVLTGYCTPEPIVWYNNEENLAVRFFTIPIEDFLYYFSLFGYIYLIYSKMKKATQ